ncbi:MAG: radical SAM protein [Eubacteriales bacterium]
MKVLLVNAWSRYVKQAPVIPLGLLSIATYLSKNGYTVKILDRAIDNSSLSKCMMNYKPDFVGVSAMSFRSFKDAIKISKAAKKQSIPVVWGGSTVSLVPEVVLKTGVVDFVAMGEGEVTMLALLEAYTKNSPICDVDGVSFINAGQIVVNKDRELADLADFPVIDFSFVDPARYFVKYIGCEKMLFIYSSKGCVGHCTFCYNPAFSRCKWRPRPPEHYLSEIKYLAENFGLDGVTFADDLLSPNREFLQKFCNDIQQSGIDFVWGCEFRADTCEREDIQLLYDSGCRWIFFGIESGSPERQKFLRKGINLEKAKKTVQYCKEIGIVSSASFMIGMPGETSDELLLTINYMRELNVDFRIASIFGPLPGSEIYRNLVNEGKLNAPETYEDWLKIKWMDSVGYNFSHIPDIELRVVSSYLMLAIFNNKAESRIWAQKAISNTLQKLKKISFKSLILFFVSVKEFLGIVFYATMFPKIRKKYGLTKK